MHREPGAMHRTLARAFYVARRLHFDSDMDPNSIGIEGAEVQGIRLLDHVILGESRYHSFVDAGELSRVGSVDL